MPDIFSKQTTVSCVYLLTCYLMVVVHMQLWKDPNVENIMVQLMAIMPIATIKLKQVCSVQGSVIIDLLLSCM